MKNKFLTRAIIGCLVITGAFLFLHAAVREKTLASKECMETCSRKEDGGSKMIWENLSHQFFSSF